jgi:hypothetical protein
MATSSVDTQHPLYIKRQPDWKLVRDCVEGERKVKGERQTYLPATSGMRDLGMKNAEQDGSILYESYLTRAVFPEIVQPAINALVGVMHREPADIQLPAGMEDMRDNSTPEGESLQVLLRRINEQQLITGRIGLLVDVPEGSAEVIPYIVCYEAECIINWDQSRRKDGRDRADLVVLDESTNERTDRFTWEMVRKHLVLDLAPAGEDNSSGGGERISAPSEGSVYRSQLIVQENRTGLEAEGINRQTKVSPTDVPKEAVTPKLKGQTLPEIPFVFIGSVDLSPLPDQVPMLPLARLALTIYRGEADYRNTLFQQGQDTLVVTGDTPAGEGDKPPKRTLGASASLDLSPGADAKFIGVSSSGLPEQRQALENDRNRASELGANLLSSMKGGGKEAMESLKIRVAARTATIMTVVKAGAEGLQTALRTAAEWRGLNPEEVIVTPNLDFVEDSFMPSDVVDLMNAKRLGAPISMETVHRYLKEKDLTVLEFEEELRKIEEEEPETDEAGFTPEERAAQQAEELELMKKQQEQGNQDPNANPDDDDEDEDEDDDE